jgi:hypothetical protein
MQRYKNRSGESGVVAYEIQSGGIVVQFVGGDKYLYTDKSAGAAFIKQMQCLAEDGVGLSTFISRHVHDKFEKKLS